MNIENRPERPTLTPGQLNAVARAVAGRLFENGFGDKAERLVLWRDSDSKNLGGWCRGAVEDHIGNALKAAIQTRELPNQTPCPLCHGRGTINLRNLTRKVCPDCHGTGRLQQ